MKKETIAVKTIKLIEAEAHIPGLTDKIKAFLEKETGVKLEAVNAATAKAESQQQNNQQNNNKEQ